MGAALWGGGEMDSRARFESVSQGECGHPCLVLRVLLCFCASVRACERAVARW